MNVMKIAPETAIKFMAYEQAKKLIRGNNTREVSIYERFVAGSVAGGISQTVIYPLEVYNFIKLVKRVNHTFIFSKKIFKMVHDNFHPADPHIYSL